MLRLGGLEAAVESREIGTERHLTDTVDIAAIAMHKIQAS
jgi:hypothetical protein